MLIHLWWWFQHVTGVDAPGSRAYNFWSGFAGDVPIFAAALAFYFHHQCTDITCHHWGRHKFRGSPYCKKHHPELAEPEKIE